MNTDQIFFNHSIKDSIIILGDIINAGTVIKAQFMSINTDDKSPAIAEFDNLLKTLTEVQMTFADIDILLTPSLENLHPKVKLDNITQISQVLLKVSQEINSKLPVRETPLIARGNQLAILLFKLANNTNLSLSLISHGPDSNQTSQVTGQFLESIAQFSQTAARWANIFINQKEYIWTEPGQAPVQNQPNPPVEPTNTTPPQPQS